MSIVIEQWSKYMLVILDSSMILLDPTDEGTTS